MPLGRRPHGGRDGRAPECRQRHARALCLGRNAVFRCTTPRVCRPARSKWRPDPRRAGEADAFIGTPWPTIQSARSSRLYGIYRRRRPGTYRSLNGTDTVLNDGHRLAQDGTGRERPCSDALERLRIKPNRPVADGSKDGCVVVIVGALEVGQESADGHRGRSRPTHHRQRRRPSPPLRARPCPAASGTYRRRWYRGLLDVRTTGYATPQVAESKRYAPAPNRPAGIGGGLQDAPDDNEVAAREHRIVRRAARQIGAMDVLRLILACRCCRRDRTHARGSAPDFDHRGVVVETAGLNDGGEERQGLVGRRRAIAPRR